MNDCTEKRYSTFAIAVPFDIYSFNLERVNFKVSPMTRIKVSSVFVWHVEIFKFLNRTGIQLQRDAATYTTYFIRVPEIGT